MPNLALFDFVMFLYRKDEKINIISWYLKYMDAVSNRHLIYRCYNMHICIICILYTRNKTITSTLSKKDFCKKRTCWKPGMTLHVSNSGTREAKAGDHYKFKASQGYAARLCLKQPVKPTHSSVRTFVCHSHLCACGKSSGTWRLRPPRRQVASKPTGSTNIKLF